MNNEPVAWMSNGKEFYVQKNYCPDFIPLYTHPAEHKELKDAVRSFFQDFIDIREESDSGRVFAPITISSSRCMMTEPLAEVLAKMRKLSGSEK
jgi:hypothetical protein